MNGTSGSLAGAVAASRRLPAGQGTELLHAAREAFAVSLHVTGVIAAVIFAGLAVQAIPAVHGHDPLVASQPGGG